MINLDHAWQRVIVQSDHITSEHVANYNSRVTITHKNGKCNKSRVNLTIQKSRVTKSDHITSEHVSNYKLRVDITNDHAWSKGIISRVNTFQIINHEWTLLMITRDKYFYLWFVHWWTPRTWTKLWWLWQHCKVQSRVDLEQFHLVQRPKSNGETTWLPKYWADIACKLHLTIRTSRLFLSILFRHLLQLLRQPENNWKITKYLKQIWNWKNVAIGSGLHRSSAFLSFL